MQELIRKIEQWAIDRELDKNGTVEAQTIKTIEELSELMKGICKNDMELITDSIGDVFVTLVVGNMLSYKKKLNLALDTWNDYEKESSLEDLSYILDICEEVIDSNYKPFTVWQVIRMLESIAFNYDLTLKECVQYAYDEIKNRKGKMIDGQFVKESDL